MLVKNHEIIYIKYPNLNNITTRMFLLNKVIPLKQICKSKLLPISPFVFSFGKKNFLNQMIPHFLYGMVALISWYFPPAKKNY